jgi:hypothetical protein
MNDREEILLRRMVDLLMEIGETQGRLEVYSEQCEKLKEIKKEDRHDAIIGGTHHFPMREIGDAHIRMGSLCRRQADIIDELKAIHKDKQ